MVNLRCPLFHREFHNSYYMMVSTKIDSLGLDQRNYRLLGIGPSCLMNGFNQFQQRQSRGLPQKLLPRNRALYAKYGDLFC
jgi:hypothetical protein